MSLENLKSVQLKDLKVNDEVNLYHYKDVNHINPIKIIRIKGTYILGQTLYPKRGNMKVKWYNLSLSPGGDSFLYLYLIRYRL